MDGGKPLVVTENLSERQVRLVTNSSTATFHLVAGHGAREMVLFGCDQAPLLTFSAKGYLRDAQFAVRKNPLENKKLSMQGCRNEAHGERI
jgi:hypothetical protein